MISEDKQIMDMAKVIADKTTLSIIEATGVAEILAAKDYRKASDVAREIFEEIEDIRLEHSYGEIDGNELNVKLFNLKKKYESEGEG